MSELILTDQQGSVAILTLNRPEKLNALNYATIDRLLALLSTLEADQSVHALIITGSGSRAFSAGGDIPEFYESIREGTDVAVREFVRRGQRLTARLEAFPKPTIAAVNGIAFGGGCEITEAVHLAVASDQALFAKPEIKIGIPPTFGGTQRLPRLAGRKKALELLLTGEPFTPARALELGLINKVVPSDQVMPAAMAMANSILRHSPLTASRILAAVTRGLNTTIAEGLEIEANQFAQIAGCEEVREKLEAWIERRTPGESGT
ncbi:MAG: crotonase/enoyl-CoA hydratase family protein [Stappiaceae bacterium]